MLFNQSIFANKIGEKNSKTSSNKTISKQLSISLAYSLQKRLKGSVMKYNRTRRKRGFLQNLITQVENQTSKEFLKKNLSKAIQLPAMTFDRTNFSANYQGVEIKFNVFDHYKRQVYVNDKLISLAKATSLQEVFGLLENYKLSARNSAQRIFNKVLGIEDAHAELVVIGLVILLVLGATWGFGYLIGDADAAVSALKDISAELSSMATSCQASKDSRDEYLKTFDLLRKIKKKEKINPKYDPIMALVREIYNSATDNDCESFMKKRAKEIAKLSSKKRNVTGQISSTCASYSEYAQCLEQFEDAHRNISEGSDKDMLDPDTGYIDNSFIYQRSQNR